MYASKYFIYLNKNLPIFAGFNLINVRIFYLSSSFMIDTVYFGPAMLVGQKKQY